MSDENYTNGSLVFHTGGTSFSFRDAGEELEFRKAFALGNWMGGFPVESGHISTGEYAVGFGYNPDDGFLNDMQVHDTGVPAPGVNPDLTFPIVANVTGRGGVKYLSSMRIVNVGDADIDANAMLTLRADLGGTSVTTTLKIPAHTQVSVDNPIPAWFNDDTNAVGTVMLRVPNGDPQALFATSTVTAHNPDGSEFGQYVPANPTFGALRAGETAYFNTTPDVTKDRDNFLVYSLEDGTHGTVSLLQTLDTPAADPLPFTLDQGHNLQLNDIFSTFHVAPFNDALIALHVDAGWCNGVASVLDGVGSYTGTSDPTTVAGVRGGVSHLTFFEVGHIFGLNEYSGSLEVTNFSTTTANVKAEFFARGVPGVAASNTFDIPAGQTRGFDNVVPDLFGIDGQVGAIVLTTTNGTGINGLAREHSDFRNAQGNVTGTASQRVPPLVDPFSPIWNYCFPGLRQTGTTAGTERAHLSLFDPGDVDGTATATIFDGASGQEEGTKTWTVRAKEVKRVNFVLSDINPSVDSQPKYLIVSVDQPMYVLVSTVNKDGDPVTIEPFPF